MTTFQHKKGPIFATAFLLAVFLFFSNVALADTTAVLRPIADGGNDSADWTNTTGAACNTVGCSLEVKETSGASCTNSDGDTTFVSSIVSGANQTFNLDGSGIPNSATVTGVSVTTCYTWQGGGATAPTFQTRVCLDNSCSNSGTTITGSASYTESTQSHTVNFRKTSTSDVEIGLAKTNPKNLRVSQISAVITYTPDTTAPAAVSNLALSGASNSAMTVSWTAPGNDGSTGTATTYDIRYSTSAITSGNFSSATAVTGAPTPLVAGTSQSMTVTGLSPSTTYYFAIKTSDEVPNTSAISNLPSLATTATPDTTAPAAVSNLALSSPTTSSLLVSWTAPGDDGSTGTATSYDIRYSTSNITTGNWASATQVSGEPTPLVAGTSQSMTVIGLSPSTTYFFAIKTSDEVPNESNLSNITSLATTVAETPQPTNIVIPASGGGGPSGGVQATTARFAGQAYPGSTIEVLKKDNINTQYANIPLKIYSISPEGVFEITLAALLQGQYFFALTAKDKDGRTTGILPFSVDFISSERLVAEDIFLPPTVGLAKTVISTGGDLTLVGYSAPNSEIEIVIDSANKAVTTSDKNGSYNFATSTAGFKLGDHNIKARQKNQSGRYSDFSLTRVFRISQLISPKADLNGDDKVGIADWSIFLFRWASKDAKLKNTVDLDGNGVVNIADLSIFLKLLKI